jgi:hypothetical protein
VQLQSSANDRFHWLNCRSKRGASFISRDIAIFGQARSASAKAAYEMSHTLFTIVEWRLDKAQDFLAQPFTAGWVWECSKDNFTAKRLHALENFLGLAPVFDGFFESGKLFSG